MRSLLLAAIIGLVLGATCRADTTPPSKDDEVGTISGIAIARGDGWLGIEIKGGSFALTFYNGKKKPVPADATSAVARWSVHYQPNEERTELVPSGDPAVLSSPYPVKPPHTFILHLVLLFEGKPDASEAYTVNFSE
jgi:hypothetical protein